MPYKTAIAVPRSGNQWIDGLTDGFRWGVTPDDPSVGFTFIGDTANLPNGEFGGYPSWGWTAAERRRMERSMQAIEEVCALRFVDRGDNNYDNVELWFYTLDNANAEGTYGYAYTPGSDADEGLVAINWSSYRSANGSLKHSIAPGSFYGITHQHELSHAVGLKHPHERGLLGQPRFPGLSAASNEFRDKGDYEQNAHPFTQLSYVDKGARNGLVPRSKADYGFLQKLGALDVAAMQWAYGINATAAAGDDTYQLPVTNQEGTGWQAIWDTGGWDRIKAPGASASVTIDLRNATLGSDVHAGGFISRMDGITGGFTIAHDWNGEDLGRAAGLCVIEEALGGKKSDLLIGNSASNILKGRRGGDVIYAGAGVANRVVGGKGADQFLIHADPGAYVEVKDFDARNDRLVFDVSSERVTFQSTKNHTNILVDDVVAAKLADAPELDPDRHVTFSGFQLFGL